MTELVANQKQSSIERKFHRFWILTSAVIWPAGWAAIKLGNVPISITVVIAIFLVQILEPKKPAYSTNWLWSSLIGLYVGFEFSWITGDGNLIDLMALAVVGSLGIVVYEALFILIIAGPIWLLLAFASLICPVERAKWRSLLFPIPAKSFVTEWCLHTGVLAVVVVIGGVSSSLIHRLGIAFGWSMTGTEFNVAIRFVFGLAGGVIISRVGQRLIELIGRRIHHSVSAAR